ncbi:Tubulin-specific chaperone D [Lachnellula subtilissima]|uniref:Tubulin-specific chaperone D n=1 Tax=Lachnellula subtilissima TaxID=602034 RepID=A0A8H8RUN8_9HELO|nr:Tubulin-specific chaperone D [Lachnellula subtilissima]
MTTQKPANASSGAQGMDAPEDDRDIKLQRASADLLADLESSLKPFLWKSTSSGKAKVRRRVRVRATDRLVILLEPFQELPQLLDPHLDKLVPVLADAFLADLQSPPSKNQHAVDSQLLVPVSRSICRLLYTFCKIRGEKVIVRFLSTETRHLELLLSAIEAGSGKSATTSDAWGWEERYITLLWLSQLLLAPFDLASISSADTVDITQAAVSHLEWPPNVPAVALRVIPLAIQYLSSPGKERDAAKILLVRIATRRDMQQLGILRSLIRWAVLELQPSEVIQPAYHYIGILSFIAGVLVSSIGTTDMSSFLPSIFQLSQDISSSENVVFNAIQSSAVARKTVIKVLRSIAALDLSSSSEGSERVESIIGTLLEYISDLATPVRLAASKALSMVALKLEPEMAAQVVEAVIDSLAAGVKWLEPPVNNRGFHISNANPLEWHGLILTLSHLLYRRSVPLESLDSILTYLAIGLSFEQRSTSGSSIGANVRDASCFGIWALARRFSTKELSSVTIKAAALSSPQKASALQCLATELVISGCLDPAGNIRRGASAALQELIGRHPDTVEEGIQVVQVVDYHSVALRSRAVQETAPQAARLSSHYYEGLKLALLGWRGVQDNDATMRRTIATGFGSVVWTNPDYTKIRLIITDLASRLRSLQVREAGEAHGLILCLASVINGLQLDVSDIKSGLEGDLHGFVLSLGTFEGSVFEFLNTFETSKSPELLAESASRLMLAMYPVLRADVALRLLSPRGVKDNDIVVSFLEIPSLDLDASFEHVTRYLGTIEELYQNSQVCRPNEGICKTMRNLLSRFLALDDIDPVSEAAAGFLFLLDSSERSLVILDWIQRASSSNRNGEGKIYLRALLKAFPIAQQPQILKVVRLRWDAGQERHDIEICSTILLALRTSMALPHCVAIVGEGLDDYTTDARGDIGSLLRIEAAKAAGAMKEKTLFGKLLRVSVEKLDKVRAEGQRALGAPTLPLQEYFAYFLDLALQSSEMVSLFEGYVVSADAGSEDVVRASRAALVEFGHGELVCETVFTVMKNERVQVSAMEVMGFLFDMGIARFEKQMFMFVQGAHYQTKNVRKLEAAVKLYGGMEAFKKLTSMLLHPYPTIRSLVAEELFVAKGVGLGVDWGKAKKTDIESVKRELGFD